MARRLELKKLATDEANGGRDLDFGELMLLILRAAPPGRGVTLDEMTAALDVIGPIEAALAEGADTVTLSDGQWKTLRAKLDVFPFNFVDRAVAEFGRHVRDAPEIGLGAAGNGRSREPMAPSPP